MELSELQHLFRQIHFQPTQKQEYFLKLVEEVGELSEAILKNKPKDEKENQDQIKGTIAEELYDVLCYVVYLANAYDIDLESTHELKEQENQVKYNR